MSVRATPLTAFYAPLNMLGAGPACARDWLAGLAAALAEGSLLAWPGGPGIVLYYRRLDWDSAYFGVPTYRLEYTEAAPGSAPAALAAAYGALRTALAAQGPFYLFGEVPAEDSGALAGLCLAGYRLVETRVTCIHDAVQQFVPPLRSAVRLATLDDVPALRAAAAHTVNPYDRFHADPFFSPAQADAFLATFAENSLRGFADEVLVPAEGAADAFLTARYLGPQAALDGLDVAQVVLAVSAPQRKGWHTRLLAELTARFRARGVQAACVTTQATNRATLKSYWRNGYRPARVAHIFSTFEREESA